MNTSVRTIASVLIASFVLLASCSKKDSVESAGKGTAQFSVNLSDKSADTKGPNDTTLMSYQLMISIEDMNGNAVLTDKIIPVYAFGTGFMSDKIELNAGRYSLTKFLVIAPSGAVIYASPLEGSPLAYIAMDPLPVKFSVLTGQVTSVVPEVVEVGTYAPGDFGYASFGIQIIEPLGFYAICYLDNPLIMAPTQITDAKVTVKAEDGWSYAFYLKAGVNHLVIRGGSDYYTLLVEKEGYASVTYTFSAQELRNSTSESPVGLKIPWGPQPLVLELQPGPDEGKDAMISNLQPDKNFGDHKYFEATFLSEPVLTVMRSNRSLIAFSLESLPKSAIIKSVILQLAFDLPVPLPDSSYVTDPNTGTTKYAAVLQQVIEPWDEHSVTWNNQPRTTEMNQAYIFPVIQNSNIVSVDVTGLFNNPSASALPFYGLLFRQWPDDSFPGLRFVSSDFPEANMRPKLIIHYYL